MAEDVHQQSIGTCTGIEFSPTSPIGAGERAAAKGVNFAQAPLPFSISLDGAVACRQKISVLGVIVIRRKADNRGLAVAETMGQFLRLSIGASPACEVATESGRKVHKSFVSAR